MSAKTLILTFLGLALIGSIAAAADQNVRPKPLRPFAACLDPSHVRGWSQIDDGQLLVDAGRSRYHVRLDGSCGDLGFASGIRFDSKGVGNGGRICGDAGDNVVPLGSTGISIPCSIAEISPITKEQYKSLLEGRGKPRTSSTGNAGQSSARGIPVSGGSPQLSSRD